MASRQSKSFAEVTFLEAVARRIRVYLVLKPVTPDTDSRLRSRFLGADGPDRLILEVPQGKKHKVFVPVGWEVGMAFPMGHFLLQSRTSVVDHCQFQLYPTRRIDAMVVQRPEKILAFNKRKEPRHEVDPSAHIMASLWPAEGLACEDQTAARSGQLRNFSATGLGVSLSANLPCGPGERIIVRLEEADSEECPIFQAVLKHCTQQDNGRWLAGFGDVVKLAPGQALSAIESLAAQ